MYDRVLSLGRFAPRPLHAGGPTEPLPPHVHGPIRRFAAARPRASNVTSVSRGPRDAFTVRGEHLCWRDLHGRLRSGKETDATLAALGRAAVGPGGRAARPAMPRPAAAAPKQISAHRDWSVYEVTDARGRICYVASEPTNQSGNYSRRDPPAVLVARLPGSPPSEQVSVQPGYAYRKGSSVEVKVDGREFALFTDGEHAWTRTNDEDRALIDAMKARRRA